jgi:gliding motility-associated-like protein
MILSRTQVMIRIFQRWQLLCVALIICIVKAHAQFPNPALFNTATNASGNGTLSVGSNDLNWLASNTGSTGTYVSAQSTGQVYSSWVASPYNNANWISFPHGCSTSVPALHTCTYPNNEDVYYKLTFNLPSLSCGQSISTPSTYCLSFDFFADNCVSDIHVNGVLSYSSSLSLSSQYYSSGYSSNANLTAVLCNNWQAGTNTVLVHVRSGAGLSSTNQTWEAFLAQANQTVNPSVGNPFSASVSVSNAACFGGTGSATVVATGGVGSYTYSWTPSGGTGSVATNLSAGSYSCSVSSGTGCSVTRTLNITQPTSVTINSTQSNAGCYGGTGSATLSPSGGTGPYTYSWLPSGGNASVATSLIAGTYSCVVSSSNCAQTKTLTITQPTSLTLNGVKTDPLCFGSTGSATVNATGGNGPYSYTWIPAGGSASVASGMLAGNYTCVVTTGSTCPTTSLSLTLTDPPALSVSITPVSGTVCTADSLTLFATTTGGTGAATFNWLGGGSSASVQAFSSVPGAYTYSVSASDANSCIAGYSTDVTFYDSNFLTTNTVSACEGDTVSLIASGGLTYTWQPSGINGNTFTVSPVASGSFSVNATSAFGCTTGTTSFVFLKPAPTLSFNTAAINCAYLGSATVTAAGGTGPFTFSWSPTAQTTSIATGLYPGNYTLNVADLGTGCDYQRTTYFAPLVPLTGTLATNGTVACFADATASANITLSGGSGSETYTWSGPGGSQYTQGAVNLPAGSYTVQVTDALTYCGVTQTFNIVQPSALTLSISVSAYSVCLGESIALSASGTGGTPAYTFTWTGTPQNAGAIKTETASGYYSYSVAANDAHNCSFSNTVQVRFVDNPTVSVTSVSICPQEAAILTSSGAATYSWSNFSTGNYIIVSPPSHTEYTVTGSSQGCTASAVGTVSIKPVPTVTFTHNSPVCEGDSLKMFSNSNFQYLWTGPGNFTSSQQNSFIALSTPSNSGTYSVKVTAVNGCTASASANLTVNPLPLLTAGGSTVCEGQTAHVWAGYLNGATYNWTGPGLTSTLQTVAIPNAGPANAGIYNVTALSKFGCARSQTVEVQVLSPPVAGITGTNSACEGDQVQLTGSGGGTYKWKGPVNFVSSGQSVSVGTAGFYTLTVTSGICSDDTVGYITIYSLPVPLITAIPSNPCVNEAVNFSVTGQYMAYNWAGPAFNSSSSGPVLSAPSLSDSGIYSVSVTDGNGCVGIANTSIEVLPLPSVIVGGATVCVGEPAMLVASGGESYQWTGPLAYSSNKDSALIVSASLLNSGIYTVIVTGKNGCSSEATAQLVSNPFPLPQPALTLEPRKVCLNSTAILSASGGVDYYWKGPQSFYASGTTATLSASALEKAGVYTVTVRDANNCRGTNTIEVVIYDLPSSKVFLHQDKFCVPFCVTYSLQADSGSASLVSDMLYVDGGNQAGQNGSYCLEKEGNYTFRITYSDTNACVNTSSINVVAYPTPRADFDFYPPVPVAGIDEVQFYNRSDPGYAEFKWSFSPDPLDTIRTKEPTYIFKGSGSEGVTLIAKNSFGCADTISRPIVIDDEYALYIPDAFSPNGDGINDVFQAKGAGIRSLQLQVFDRWGELMFTSSDAQQGWDGLFRGQKCTPDTYVWRIIVSGNNNRQLEYTGKVYLLK